jgi:(E)-4-hydroxy-3-methylbut-2-enyl-diphosphate synthase
MLTREIKIGNLKLGGDNPVRVQGMLKSFLDDSQGLLQEANALIKAGAELIRCALPTTQDVDKVYDVLKDLGVPLIADCHFQSGIALKAIEAGFDKIRLNPGNISKDGMKVAVELAQKNDLAIRFGFNSGSCNAKTANEFASFALELDEWVKEQKFFNYVISMKSSSVIETVEANRFFSTYSDTPLHIGITATGLMYEGIVKSSAGLGALLMDGVGDTVRVSLTGDSVQEIRIGCLLRDLAAGKSEKLQLISCPTCSRSRIDVENLLNKFIEKLDDEDYKKPFKVAIMGCEVNGPGEAKECDMGVCGTKKGGLFIKKGKIVKSINDADTVEFLINELRKL